MESTPKLKKRVSMTLGRHQRREAQPKACQAVRDMDVIALANINFISNDRLSPRSVACKSPASRSLNSDGGIECTPPHKKLNLDDSIDYSPKCFDTSFSPSCLYSQTLSSSSPEVGWKWSRRSVDDVVAVKTPDSAYAADSSFTSAGSSSTEVVNAIRRTQGGSQTQRFAYETRREEQRRQLEMQMRRAQKRRADELLKQRCAKLQEQLREVDARRQKDVENRNQMQIASQLVEISEVRPELVAPIEQSALNVALTEGDVFANANDTLDDFLNDTDSDSLLLEATQQVESKIVGLTQKSETGSTGTAVISNSITSTMLRNNCAASRSTISPISKPYSESDGKDKQSSLYKKFLEDDSPDDWFLSLDDVILQATQQPKKPRNSFSRHNSMPSKTLTTSCVRSTAICQTLVSSPLGTMSKGGALTTSTCTSAVASKMKRHASSHALSLSSGTTYSYRDRQQNTRK